MLLQVLVFVQLNQIKKIFHILWDCTRSTVFTTTLTNAYKEQANTISKVFLYFAEYDLMVCDLQIRIQFPDSTNQKGIIRGTYL